MNATLSHPDQEGSFQGWLISAYNVHYAHY